MKSRFKKLLLILLISCLTVTTALFVASCNKDKPTVPEHTQHVDSDNDGLCDVCSEPMQGNNSDGNETDEKLTYSVTLVRSSGDPLERVTIVASDGEDMVGFGVTDANGVATFKAPAGEYTLELATSQVPAGYHVEKSYPISSKNPSITIKLSASVITDAAMPSNTSYTLGSVMYDFSFTDSQGRSNTLAGLLAKKKMVLINFWYIGCTWCLYEFPDMKSAYLSYSNDVAIVALDPVDSTSKVEHFRTDESYNWGEGGLPFHMVAKENACTQDLAARFGVAEFPTSILIDREGVVCFIAKGAGKKEEFLALFEKYTAEPYEQDIVFPGENDSELPLPDVDAPPSAQIEAAINDTASGFNASYYFVPKGQEESHVYNWPWIIDSDQNGSYIHPSNAGYHNSYSIIYTDITISTDLPVIAFDYKVSCEKLTGLNGYGDALYVYIDGTIITAISGLSDGWQTCYAYVPLRDGTYTLSLAYVKDDNTHEGDDTVYVKNMRFLSKDNIDGRVEIHYQASSGPALDQGYTYYEKTVYNSTDGYYHVDDANGPLLLADLMNYNTHWSEKNAYEYVMNGGFTMNDEEVTERFIDYCQYANNSSIYGLVAVTAELHDFLVALTKQYGKGAENEWLELCSFYMVYVNGATGEILPDPARGLADYNAFDAVLNTGTEDTPNGVNCVDIDRALVPRGLWYKFVPQQAGVYRIMSIGDYDTYGWLRDEKLDLITESDDIDFNPNDFEGSNGNFSMTVYMTQGKVYYIAADFKYVGETGSFEFLITRIADKLNLWTSASAGHYTTEIDEDDNMLLDTVYLEGAIDYRLDSDGLYRSVNADGSLGLPIYINLHTPTYMFQEMSIAQMFDLERYYCKKCGFLYPGTVSQFEKEEFPYCDSCFVSGKDKFAKCTTFELPTPKYDKDGKVIVNRVDDGESYFIVPQYEKDGDGNVILIDYTEKMRSYCNRAMTEYPVDDDGTKHEGYIAASEELVDILMKFIIFGDHSVSPNISNAWLMLANYYLYLGPASE